MANRNEDSKRVPWLPVHDDGRQREPIAPSKPAVPAVPARHSSMFSPEPVEVEDSDSDIIAPVDAPPPEEIMPTNSRVTWDAVPVFTPPTPTAGAAAADPIRSLGDAAVTRASLSASGAPTPLGGVAPSAPSTHPSAPEPAATPPSGAATAAPAPAPAPGFMATTPPAGAGTPPRSPLQDLEDDTPPFTPLFGTPTVDRAGAGVIGGDEPPVAEKQRTPWWRSWPALVIIGLLVMGAVAYAIVMALPADEAVELTPEVIVATPDEPTHEPISIENPTPFQEALPPLVGLYALRPRISRSRQPRTAGTSCRGRPAHIRVPRRSPGCECLPAL